MPANSGTTAETITHGAYTSNTSITPATVSFPSKNPAHEERGGTGEPYLFEFGDAIRTSRGHQPVFPPPYPSILEAKRFPRR